MRFVELIVEMCVESFTIVCCSAFTITEIGHCNTQCAGLGYVPTHYLH